MQFLGWKYYRHPDVAILYCMVIQFIRSEICHVIRIQSSVPYMTPTAVRQGFLGRGWAQRAGSDLYFDGNGGTNHPHLHLLIEGRGTVASLGDIRSSVKMLAFSRGQQHLGIPGQTILKLNDSDFVQGTISMSARNNNFLSQRKQIRLGELDQLLAQPGLSQNIKGELQWWKDYIAPIVLSELLPVS
jgi:hypothetical protein